MEICHSLAEVRAQIDGLDAQIINLLALRQGYVGQAAKFKQSRAEVAAPERVAAVINKVKGQALEAGASPDVVEAVYRAMIAAFIQHEAEVYRRLTEG